MYPLKRESPSLLVTPPVNLVLINPKKNTEIDEENRRLIARVAPVCLAYDLHLWLANFGTKKTPLDFAESIAPSTSIGKGGKDFIEICKKGKVNFTDLQLPQNIGLQIICTNLPDKSKEKNIEEIVKISEENTIAFLFGISQRTNKAIKKIKDKAHAHLDITNKKIRLSLDSEIGAVCHSFFITRKA